MNTERKKKREFASGHIVKREKEVAGSVDVGESAMNSMNMGEH